MERDPILKAISDMRAFASRVRECDRRWQFLKRGGSGRIVYDYNDALVLKLARNAKGIAQNQTESDGFIQQEYAGSVVAPVLDSCPDDKWILMRKAVRAKPSDFKKILGFAWVDIQKWIRFRFPGSSFRHECMDCEQKSHAMDENEQLSELLDLACNFAIPYGELVCLSSWGIVDEKLLLIDYGITQSVYEEYYEKKPRPSSSFVR